MITKIRKMNISYKLTLVTAAASTLALFCVLFAFVVHDLRLVHQIKAEQIDTSLAVLTNNLAYAIKQDDLDTVHNLLRTTMSAHGIVAATVTDKDGQEISRYPVIKQQYTESLEGDTVKQFEREIIVRGYVIGFLQVAVSYSDVDDRVSNMLFYSAMALAFALVLGFAVAWVVQKIVVQPVLSMHKLAQDVITTRNYKLRVDLENGDELGQLGNAFNKMLAQIEQKDQKLEKQVNKRTQELQKLAEEFRYKALHDTLTGLPNRALFHEEFDRATAHANRSGKYFSVMLLDVDNFKQINDTYGHDVGDELLKTVANRIKSAIRAEDTVCRFGGDEFVLLVQDIEGERDLELVGQSILSSLDEDIWCDGRPLKVGLSIGASLYPHHGTDMNDLKHNADVAMYAAKDAGKHRLVVYNTALGHANLNRLMMQSDLKEALTKNELSICFQPQVNVLTKTVVGCEALVRWDHKNLGAVAPSEFVQHAEESGVVKQLDYFVLRKSCELAKQWRDQFGKHMTVSVNMSHRHFHSDAIIGVVRSVLKQYQMDPYDLMIELTETAILQEPAKAHEIIDAIRACKVCIFSLSWLTF